ncbi:hypothetical protein ESY86_05225 [Subsaximicrobium wynnwilliamsii]|uniref:Uncharacterized protein n=1 Tax=Subsaximicrobium wynnwilliamsii TaxID=291179 RepID=A0A5C6ZJZ5_9FLAO|nr:SprB repeat-containing protein [Subsaximicrobium wynnwilliamsii]TXD84468.1 hypothetical protein ESY87_05005 [Subsaximicrobium wynnwilliamsii]TXD90149.1 hypothetical protein ESY86_05225 [Subsaximicrobium wynnwilliamsii]TXE04201.1 hypothetical protein ESY88_05000 [Subsaximicrobium wynnwilliamsii]
MISFLLLTTSSQSQQSTSKANDRLRVEAETGNPTSVINDGYIELNVLGGTPPFSFKWSNRETALESNKASGLVEGIPYEVIITDSQNKSISRSYTVKAQSITETFNSKFDPLFTLMSSVLF